MHGHTDIKMRFLDIKSSAECRRRKELKQQDFHECSGTTQNSEIFNPSLIGQSNFQVILIHISI